MELELDPGLASLGLDLPACAALARLAERAASQPFDLPALARQLVTPEGQAVYRARLTGLTVELPGSWCVTLLLEQGAHGTRRRTCISLAGATSGRQLSAEAVWRIAQRLGFVEGACQVWMSTRAGHGRSVNLDQDVLAVQRQHQRQQGAA